jgi:hypothetical protein
LQAYNNDENFDASNSDEEDVQYSAEDQQDQKVEFYSKQQNSDYNPSDGGENHSCDDEELVIQEIKRSSEPSNNDSKLRTLPATYIQYAEFENENLQDESEETQTQFTVQKQTLNDSLNIFSQSIDTPGS